MRALADELEKLDHYFEGKKESEKWIMILLAAGVIGYLLHIYLLPYAEEHFRQSEAVKKRLQKQIIKEELYLRGITVNGDRNFYVKKFNYDIIQRKRAIKLYKKKIALLDKNFDRLSEILFNQKSWSKMIDSIAGRANINDVEILKLSNHHVAEKANFGHVLEMSIKCEGNFNNLLTFMNDLEQSKLVTDIFYSDIHIDANRSKIVADINISVWGINR